MCRNKLSIISLGLGAGSTIVLGLAVATDYWLFTMERQKDENITQIIYMHMGFWRMCTYKIEPVASEGALQCEEIVYFSPAETSPDEVEDPSAIGLGKSAAESIRKVAALPALSLLMLMTAFVVGAIGHLRKDVKTMVAAIIYVIVGMLTALGIILFISALNDEMNHMPKSDDEDQPLFEYWYGYSFFLCGSAFITSQVAAVSSISVYLRRHNHVDDMLRLIPGMHRHNVRTLPPYHGSPDTPRLKLHYPNSKIYNPHFNSSPSNSAGKSSNSSLTGTAGTVGSAGTAL